MDSDVIDLSAPMLGLPGLVVLASGECGGELEVVVETTDTTVGCARCAVAATPHARRDHLLRDVPSAGRAVLLV